MKEFDVVAIGNAIVDVLAKVDDEFLKKHSLAKGGMTLISEEESNSIYSDMPSATEISGGSAANTVAGVASFGGSAAFIGKVKNDQLGKIFEHDLNATGVYYKTPKAETGPRTANSLVSVTPDAQRTMATYLGATRYITPDDMDAELIANAKVTYLEGYLWDEAEAKAAIRKAIEIAKDDNRKISFSLSDTFCVERHKNEFIELIEDSVDILFCNEAEIMALMEEDDFDNAVKKIAGHCEIVAITRGAKGSIVIADELYVIQAEKNLKVVDTTGAGDLYAGGFLYGYTQGFSPEKCGRLGTIAASEIIQHIGARPEVKLSDFLRDAA